MILGSLHEVIAEFVHDGQSIALEGFTHLIPFAAGHEIIRQQRRRLHLIRMRNTVWSATRIRSTQSRKATPS